MSLASLAADLPTVALTAGAMAAHQNAGATAAQGSVAKLAKLIEVRILGKLFGEISYLFVNDSALCFHCITPITNGNGTLNELRAITSGAPGERLPGGRSGSSLTWYSERS